jgi:hypothetical protein
MADENKWKEALISAFEHLKSQDALLSILIVDVAALREVLGERDMATLVRYEELLAAKVAEATPKIAASSGIFDEIIRVLKGSVGWTN